MTAPLFRKKTFTLEDLLRQFGALELQEPLSRETFTSLANPYPGLILERHKNGITTIISPVKRGSGKR